MLYCAQLQVLTLACILLLLLWRGLNMHHASCRVFTPTQLLGRTVNIQVHMLSCAACMLYCAALSCLMPPPLPSTPPPPAAACAAAAPDSPLHQYLDNIAGMAWSRPGQFLLVLGLIVAAAGLLALQLWIIVTPLSPNTAAQPLLLRQTATDSQAQQEAWQHQRQPASCAAAGAAAASAASASASKAAALAAWGGAGGGAPSGKPAAAVAAAAYIPAGWSGLVSPPSRSVVVGWGVPGVREWLLGSQAAAPPAEEAALLLPGPAGTDDTVRHSEQRCMVLRGGEAVVAGTMRSARFATCIVCIWAVMSFKH